jgi:ERCC4-related helicase
MRMGLIRTTNPRVPKKVLLEIGQGLQKRPDGMPKFVALSHYATVMNLTHAHELLETQGISAFLSFMQKLEEKEEKSKAVLRILNDERVQTVLKLARSYEGEHPKLAKLVEVLEGMRGKKVIVFVQFRAQVKRVVEELSAKGFSAKQFVGKKDGVTLAEQKGTIKMFREGKFDVMVASSIGEEGLDIPSVDAVVFYEPIPSEIRSIQRRGRAGRAKAGDVVILITKDTRDEAYYWSARNKEARMKKIVGGMQREMESKKVREAAKAPKAPPKAGQARVTDFL